MAVLSTKDIFTYALQAGFTPDEAVTMTAIALAESGGNTGALNSKGEDSRGLWQINLDAHRDADWAQGLDMANPAHNAIAAYHVSGGGDTISPWTVTHRRRGAKYLDRLDEAQSAAAEAGYPDVQGNANPPEGYGDHVPASYNPGDPVYPPGSFGPSDVVTPPVLDGDDGGAGGTLRTFLDSALRQQGDTYVFGAEASLDDADPGTFDCSELVEWAADQAGVKIIDGSRNQYQAVRDAGLEMTVEEALTTPGALLFRFSPKGGHVAISLGDGRTIEAKGSKYGVGIFEAGDRFELAGRVPGIDYQQLDLDLSGIPTSEGQPLLTEPSEYMQYAAANEGGTDTDSDLLADHLETKLGLDPANPDSDGDGITDGYELLVLHTKADRVDTDFDSVPDDIEVALGSDPLVADNLAPGGQAPALPADLLLDSDGDGLGDYGEELAGTDPFDADSDDDAQLDGFEFGAGSDPLDPASTAAMADQVIPDQEVAGQETFAGDTV